MVYIRLKWAKYDKRLQKRKRSGLQHVIEQIGTHKSLLLHSKTQENRTNPVEGKRVISTSPTPSKISNTVFMTLTRKS